MEQKEERIRAIVRLYYSNPKLQQYLLEFSQNRETVPRYYEGFGKRPDTLQYVSDIMSLVNKGATSFHSSEEIWNDPLSINSEMNQEEFGIARKGWDLLIDIDSPFLDFSKIAAKLLLEELEFFGIKNYAVKFSGSKGFHIIIPSNAFPENYDGKETKKMFPEWPRAICEYLMSKIKPRFSTQTRKISNIEAMQIRTNKKKEDLVEVVCPECGKPAKEDKLVTLYCDYCSNENKIKKSFIAKKRVLRCEKCNGHLSVIKEEDFFECLDCKVSNISKFGEKWKNEKFAKDVESNVVSMSQGLQEEEIGGFDLVLVAPRHLFRMPYSLHEKTSLASVVIDKNEIENFSPKDANALTIQLKSFYPKTEKDEAKQLLIAALDWKKEREEKEEHKEKVRREQQSYEPANLEGVEEKDFPPAINKLLKGMKDGRKRGLFILLTFLKSLNFSDAYIENMVAEWNKKNEVPLKQGYVKSQLDWHFRQKKKILPPNYDNAGFYKDLGLIDKPQLNKNPIVDVVKSLRKRKGF